MTSFIPLILITASILVIFFIIKKHYVEILELEIDGENTQKDVNFKEKIIINRLKRDFIGFAKKLQKFFIPLYKKTKLFFNDFYKKLYEIKEKNQKELNLSKDNIPKTIRLLFREADNLFRDGEIDKAEKKLINIVELDNKNIGAFRALSQVYSEEKKYEEAISTLKYVIKLGGDDQDCFDLALAYQINGQVDHALKYIKKALILSPNNPRYLDNWLEISIMKKDKIEAFNAYEKLEKVNPENAKLKKLKAQIKEL